MISRSRLLLSELESLYRNFKLLLGKQRFFGRPEILGGQIYYDEESRQGEIKVAIRTYSLESLAHIKEKYLPFVPRILIRVDQKCISLTFLESIWLAHLLIELSKTDTNWIRTFFNSLLSTVTYIIRLAYLVSLTKLLQIKVVVTTPTTLPFEADTMFESVRLRAASSEELERDRDLESPIFPALFVESEQTSFKLSALEAEAFAASILSALEIVKPRLDKYHPEKMKNNV